MSSMSLPLYLNGRRQEAEGSPGARFTKQAGYYVAGQLSYIGCIVVRTVCAAARAILCVCLFFKAVVQSFLVLGDLQKAWRDLGIQAQMFGWALLEVAIAVLGVVAPTLALSLDGQVGAQAIVRRERFISFGARDDDPAQPQPGQQPDAPAHLPPQGAEPRVPHVAVVPAQPQPVQLDDDAAMMLLGVWGALVALQDAGVNLQDVAAELQDAAVERDRRLIQESFTILMTPYVHLVGVNPSTWQECRDCPAGVAIRREITRLQVIGNHRDIDWIFKSEKAAPLVNLALLIFWMQRRPQHDVEFFRARVADVFDLGSGRLAAVLEIINQARIDTWHVELSRLWAVWCDEIIGAEIREWSVAGVAADERRRQKQHFARFQDSVALACSLVLRFVDAHPELQEKRQQLLGMDDLGPFSRMTILCLADRGELQNSFHERLRERYMAKRYEDGADPAALLAAWTSVDSLIREVTTIWTDLKRTKQDEQRCSPAQAASLTQEEMLAIWFQDRDPVEAGFDPVAGVPTNRKEKILQLGDRLMRLQAILESSFRAEWTPFTADTIQDQVVVAGIPVLLRRLSGSELVDQPLARRVALVGFATEAGVVRSFRYRIIKLRDPAEPREPDTVLSEELREVAGLKGAERRLELAITALHDHLHDEREAILEECLAKARKPHMIRCGETEEFYAALQAWDALLPSPRINPVLAAAIAAERSHR
ncbi:MAG: hypothetical protein ACKVOH_00090 [Chlamydiales bacterium]